MKKWISGVVLSFLLLFSAVAAGQGVPISFEPITQTVALGTPVDVALTISGLVDQVAPSLGVFDLNVLYDPAILSFNGVIYGDPFLGDQLDLAFLGSFTATIPGPGFVNLFELSMDTSNDLDGLQADSFTLATLTFNTIGVGTSSLDIGGIVLGDSLGYPLFAHHIIPGSVTVTDAAAPIPEPATFLLLGSGLAGLWGMRRRLIADS